MIIPSIDIAGGRAVQLIGGKRKALDAGDPRPLAERFRLVGEIAVIDLDAAMGKGSNKKLIREITAMAPCRVGGGIRDVKTAVEWLDAGAAKVILGTAATPEILRELPADRLIVALDAYQGEVVVEGWRKPTGRSVLGRMQELEGLSGGFLVTFVELEGLMRGTAPLAEIVRLKEAARKAALTIAGGITAVEEIRTLDALGVDAQVGMALYTGKIDLSEAIAALLRSDRPDGLWATVVADEAGKALGLAWSDLDSLREAVRSRTGVYRSRTRGLWRKGSTSGAGQELLKIDLDCDRDALRFTVRQKGAGFCHTERWTCFGEDRGISALARKLEARARSAPPGSYTRRLLSEPLLLAKKLVEEAEELGRAGTRTEALQEAADLMYFTLVAMVRAGIRLADVERELDLRSLRVTRRSGEARQDEEGE